MGAAHLFFCHQYRRPASSQHTRVTPEDIKEVILMAAIYCGVSVANQTFGIVGAILRERGVGLPDAGSARA